VNCLKSKLSNYKSSFGTEHCKEDRIRENMNRIKMPKQMNVKKMIASTEEHAMKSASIKYLSIKETEIA
jgi:hypothetical protein